MLPAVLPVTRRQGPALLAGQGWRRGARAAPPVLPERTRRRRHDTGVGVAPSLAPVARWVRPRPCPRRSAYTAFAGTSRRGRATFRRAVPRPSGDGERAPAPGPKRPADPY